nr:MAG TPA: hypothetical protein [Caudoviricetes sp.]
MIMFSINTPFLILYHKTFSCQILTYIYFVL